MQGIDKLRKVLIIIFTTLSIIALVFSLAKKVGLCASDSSGGSSLIRQLPFQVGAGYGNTFTSEELSRIVEVCEEDRIYASDSGYIQIDYICLIENGSDTINVRCFQNNAGNGFSRYTGSSTTFPLSGKFRFAWGSPSGYGGCRVVSISKSSLTRINGYWASSGSTYLDCDDLTVLAPDGSFVQSQNTNVYGMPIYISSDLIYDAVTYFSNTPQHSQGGTLTDYSDQVQDFIDSDISQVDDTPPADSSSTPSWLQKILSGLTKINNTIGGGFSWVKNGLNDVSGSKLFSFFGAFHDLGDNGSGFSIPTFLGNLLFTSPTNLQNIFDASETGQAINDMKSVVRSIHNCYTATPSEHVYWTFDFSNTILENAGVITIDFDWYNSIRTPVITLFSVFFILGFIFLWLRKLPGIISGASSNSDDK